MKLAALIFAALFSFGYSQEAVNQQAVLIREEDPQVNPPFRIETVKLLDSNQEVTVLLNSETGECWYFAPAPANGVKLLKVIKQTTPK